MQDVQAGLVQATVNSGGSLQGMLDNLFPAFSTTFTLLYVFEGVDLWSSFSALLTDSTSHPPAVLGMNRTAAGC